MKNQTLPIIALLLFPWIANSQVASFFGAPGKNDVAHKIIATSDGAYLVAGQVDNDASLYKFDCQGLLLDSLRFDLGAPLSYEHFFDVLELPNGEFVAVGAADVLFAEPAVDMIVAVRVNADLVLLAADTFLVLNKRGEARSIVRTNAGQYILSGLIVGAGFDFGNVFSVTFDPVTLTPLDSITVFSYGVDNLHHVNLASNGDLLYAGGSVFGNIFLDESPLLNRAYIRRAKPDGTLVWDYTRDQTFKNKLGRAYFSDAIENPATGNVVAAGNRFTGDTLNALDAHYLLFSSGGDSLDAQIIVRPGSQNMYQTIRYSDPDTAFFSVGDKMGVNTATTFSSRIRETGLQFTSFSVSVDSVLPLSIRTVVAVPAIRFAAAGVFYNPPGVADNADCIIIIPELGVLIQQNGSMLSAIINPPGNYQYQWLYEGQPIAGATGTTYPATANGTYSLEITDGNGCSGADAIVGTQTLDVSGFQVYPNPVHDRLTVQGAHPETCILSLLDVMGRLCYTLTNAWNGEATTFDVSGLPSGQYWLKIQSATGVGLRRVVKQ